MRTENVKLDAINFDDERFRISYHFDVTILIHSIAEIGLIHPPVITYRANSPLILTGWKRVLACQTLGLSSIPCQIFEGQDDLEAFQLALKENLSFRPFTLLEKAHILNRFVQLGVPESAIVKDHLSALDIPSTPNHLDTYLRIASLDEETQAIIHSKNMVFPVIQLLIEYNEEERPLIFLFLLHLGQNKQKEVLQNLLEIAKRDGVPVQHILAHPDVQKTSSDQNLSPLQKAEAIRSHIQRQRYPTLSAWNDAFQSQKKSLKWPEDIKIEPSPFFEGEEFSVRFTFKDLDGFKGKLAQLNEMASGAKIPRLLRASPKNKNE